MSLDSPTPYEQYAAKVKAKRRAYYEANREKQLAYARQYYQDNKERYKAQREARKEEQRKYMKQRYDERKTLLNECKMQAGCQICGYNSNPVALSFHHVDPNEKELNIAQMGTASEDVLMKELEKCCILCMNCHAIIEHN